MELSNKNKSLKISVFLMIGLSVFLAGFIFFMVGSNQKIFDSKYSIYMFLPNIEGLNSGAFVTLSGLKVGVVGQLKFTEYNDHRGIRIELKIDNDYQDKITASSKAIIKTMGILGDKYVDISLGKSDELALEQGSFIQSEWLIDTSNLIADATSTLSDLKVILHNLNTISSDIVEGEGVLSRIIKDKDAGSDMAVLLKNVSKGSDKLVAGKGNLGKLLNDSTLYKSVTRTSQDIEAIVGNIRSGKGTVGQVVADTMFFPQIQSVVQKSDSLLNKLHGDGTAGRLLSDKQLYERLLNLTRELEELTVDFKENPGKYVSFSVF